MTGQQCSKNIYVPAVCFFSWQSIHWGEKLEWRWWNPPALTAPVAKWKERECRQGLWTQWMNGRWENCKSASYLPEEEETKSNFNGSQPDCIEIHDKIHELLSVGRNQIHNLAHGASPPSSAVYHQWLYPKQQRKNLQCNYTINIQKNSHHHLFKPELFSSLDREEEFSLFAILTKVMSRG